MSIGFEAIKEVCKRYRTIWKSVWDIREQLDPPKRDEDERAFLPAHLELTETPVSAAPKYAARFIMAFFFITLLWACFGHMDIVASAEGKTIYTGHSKLIQSADNATVLSIHVENGQHVNKGDVLIELDILGARSELEKSTKALESAQLAKARSEALLEALALQKTPELDMTPLMAISEPERNAAERLTLSQYQTWRAQDERIEAAIRQKIAENTTALAQVKKLKESISVLTESTKDYETLLKKKGISKHAYFDKKRELADISNELLAQNSRLVEIEEAMIQQKNEQVLALEQLKRDTLDQLRIAKEQIGQANAEKDHAQQRLKLSTIHAPVSGTVQQLVIHTVGGVVTPAQVLMVVVPDEDYLEVEVMVPNKDIGFIEVGQPVTIKIESFPYTRYGYIEGTVKSVSFDAIEDEKKGLIFQTIITIHKSFLMVNDKKVSLSAGMNVTAEIKTGKRRVITFFLSPLQTKVQESMRER